MKEPLTIEQQLKLEDFKRKVYRMSEEQAKDFLVRFYESAMIRDAMFQTLIRPERKIKLPHFPNL